MENKIRDTILKQAVENLHESGHTTATRTTLFTNKVHRAFFKKMLISHTGTGSEDFNKECQTLYNWIDRKLIVTVRFEDSGQDFSEFVLSLYHDYKFGYVVDCTPFQRDIWVGHSVLNGKPKVGEYLTISQSPNSDVMQLKHLIEYVEVH
jgi:hypothetical protein